MSNIRIRVSKAIIDCSSHEVKGLDKLTDTEMIDKLIKVTYSLKHPVGFHFRKKVKPSYNVIDCMGKVPVPFFIGTEPEDYDKELLSFDILVAIKKGGVLFSGLNKQYKERKYNEMIKYFKSQLESAPEYTEKVLGNNNELIKRIKEL